jgi:hypothetical protein
MKPTMTEPSAQELLAFRMALYNAANEDYAQPQHTKQLNILVSKIFKNRIEKLAALSYLFERTIRTTNDLDQGTTMFLIDQLILDRREETVGLLELCLDKASIASAYAREYLCRADNWTERGAKSAHTRMHNKLQELAEQENTSAQEILEGIETK